MRHARLWAFGLFVVAAEAALAATPFEADEKRMAKLVNADRAKHKLPPLTYHPGLARVARAHSIDMRDNRFFAHESKRTGKVKDRLAKARIGARAAGENLARGLTVEQAEINLMNSPPHRKNILTREFTHIGVGIVKQGQILLCTQVFIRAVPVYDPKEVVEKILTGINDARREKGLRRLVKDESLMRLAQEHSERAARLGRAQHLWLHGRMKASRRWRIIQSGYYLTDKPSEVTHSVVALGRSFDHYGVGLVQSSPQGKTAGALWVTLICAGR